MIVARRPPWAGRRDEPCRQPDNLWHSNGMETPYGDGAVIDYPRRLFQKWGYVDDIVRSESVEFSPEEWEHGVLAARWIEVITLDWKHALRARCAELVTNKAQIKRVGVDIIQVYLPVFRADRLRSLGDLHV